MADLEISNTPLEAPPPTTEEGFLADRQAFWSSFTGLVTTATIGVAVLLIILAFWLT